MNKFEQGKIYKLVNSVNDMIYIGSTIEPLHRRWVSHLTDYKRRPNNKLYKKIHEIGIENFKIILISIYPCKSKEQLIKREREEYDKYNTDILLNIYRPKITKEEEIEYNKKHKKEYYELHKNDISEKQKEYYHQNLYDIKEKDSKRKKKLYIRTIFLRLLPLYNVNQKETHLYF